MPLVDGLYKLTMYTPRGDEYGVAYLREGRIRGGDSGMAYVGSYSQVGSRITAELCITQHWHVPGVVSALGYNDIVVQLEGSTDGGSAEVTGSSRDKVGMRFSAKLTHLAD